MHPVLRIGLTGGIGSGKSTVCRMFADLGVPVIDADEIARDLANHDQSVLRLMLQSFGPDIISSSGELDRARLRNLVFSDDAARNKLENILHPLIYKEIECRLEALDHPYCLVTIPLLVEKHAHQRVDRVLVIDATEEQQIERAAARDHADREDILRIMQVQGSRVLRLSAADDIIHNDGDLAYLQKQVIMLHDYYNKIAAQGSSLAGAGDK